MCLMGIGFADRRAVQDRSIEFGRAPAFATCLTPGRSGSLLAAARQGPWAPPASLGRLGLLDCKAGPAIGTMAGPSRRNRPWRAHVIDGARGLACH
jgi:hypothetical protein